MKKSKTILIADDLRTNRMVIKEALEKEEYTFIEASNGKEAVEFAIVHKPDVIIMDGLMPVMDGFEAIHQLRMIETFKRTPILMISSLLQDDTKLKAIESGVNDFITKPFEKMELIARCRSYMDISHTNSQYVLSTQNPYTKMPNRAALNKYFSSKKSSNIFIIRIDNFCSVDTFYGETYARILEQEFVNIVISHFHSLNLKILCYHTGSGEFVIVLDNDESSIQINMYQFCKTFYEHIKASEINFNDITYDVSATICFASGVENLYEDASFTLDWAIENNKTFIIMSEVIDKLKQDTKENIARVHMVKKAIEEDRIVPYFQPLFDNKKREIIKYEALVRLIDEDGKVLSPYFFLDAAKNANYYLKITIIMLEKVFEIFKYVDYEVAVNISYLDIVSVSTSDAIMVMLHNNPDVARRLTFELLEDEEVEDQSVLESFISKVREYGVKIAIDDFGSGYSNFQRLMDLNPDFVKIDGSIIKHLAKDKKSEILSNAINTFSHSLGIKTVAEFVSDKEIFDKVTQMKIDYTQGYYVAEPSAKLVTHFEDNLEVMKD